MENNLVNYLKVCDVIELEMATSYIPKRGRPRRGCELTAEQREEAKVYKAEMLRTYMVAYREEHKDDIKKAMREYYQLPEVKEKMRIYNRERIRRVRAEKKAQENV